MRDNFPVCYIVINEDFYMWNQNGKLVHPQRAFSLNIQKENFPIRIKIDEIEYVVDRGFVTHGYDSVREIFIKLLHGKLILYNKCAFSFLSQFEGIVLFQHPSSVELENVNFYGND